MKVQVDREGDRSVLRAVYDNGHEEALLGRARRKSIEALMPKMMFALAKRCGFVCIPFGELADVMTLVAMARSGKITKEEFLDLVVGKEQDECDER